MKRILSVLTLLAMTMTGIGANWTPAPPVRIPSLADREARALQRFHSAQPNHWRAYVLHR
jgi:hypothetical protein